MRVLWFSVTASLFNPKSNSFNGGGWIASLEQIVKQDTTIKLGVAFYYESDRFKYETESTFYYPIKSSHSLLSRILNVDNIQDHITNYLKIIDDFRPDIIQIFGSENDFGLIPQYTNIPVVIHMQGCLPPYHNALFPVGMNKYDFYFNKGLSWRSRLMGIRAEPSFRMRAESEIQTIRNCHYFMGRTEWDKRLVTLFNPQAMYFHCDEALRDSFLRTSKQWTFHKERKKRIISVISSPWYKGADLILKTANLLKRFTSLDFEWLIFGVRDLRFYEHKYNIRASDVNVFPMGTASKDELVDALCSSALFVHPSYIDNSPNSVCEAQYLGVPVLATNVGGISTIVCDGKTGILFPANDPYILASRIQELASDAEKCLSLSKGAKRQATERHDPDKILKTLLSVYHTIIHNEKTDL